VVWLTTTIVAACGGGGGGGPDATTQVDAAVCSLTMCGTDCVDTSSNHDHCHDCESACTPAQTCSDSTCACPEIAISADNHVLSQMDDQIEAPTILGIAVYADGSLIDAVVVGFDGATPVGTEIDLAAVPGGSAPFVGLGFDVDVATRTYRAVYRATSGTLHLDRACSNGVSGTITGAALVEVDPESDEIIPDGCTAAIDSLAFDDGGPCTT
jgi:hypothetical protein